MEHTPPPQPLELHCQAIVHLAPGTFEIRGEELFINALSSPSGAAGMAEQPSALPAPVALLTSRTPEGMKPDPRKMLDNWKRRGYVSFDDVRKLFVKCPQSSVLS